MSGSIDFEEFQSDTIDAWRERVQKELKGKDASEVDAKFDSGLRLQPYYTAANDQFRIGKTGSANSWFIRLKFQAALVEVKEQFSFEFDGDAIDDLKEQFNSIASNGHLVSIKTNAPVEVASSILEMDRSSRRGLSGSVDWSPLKIDSQGKLVFSEVECKELLNRPSPSPLFRWITIDGLQLNNDGASVTTELVACILAGNEALSIGLADGRSIDDLSASIGFKLGTSSNYLEDIAKYRCLRQLWAAIVNVYNPEHGCSINTWIVAETSDFNKTKVDSKTNLLRLTTESMSVIIGGADELRINSHDDSDPNGERLAQNIHRLLAYESGLDRAKDPAHGSYFIEQLTDALCDQVWAQFQEMETLGGIKSPEVQDTLIKSMNEHRHSIIDKVNSDERTVIGLNKYQSPFDSDRAHSDEPGIGRAYQKKEEGQL